MFAVLLFALAQPPKIEVVNLCPPKIEVVNLCPAAPAVAARTFLNGSYHAGHDCPNCGYERQRTPITGYVGRQHRHDCQNCPTWWVH